MNFYFLHLVEQYLTSSQHSFHFLRHENGRPQVIQVLVGKLDLNPFSLVLAFIQKKFLYLTEST